MFMKNNINENRNFDNKRSKTLDEMYPLSSRPFTIQKDTSYRLYCEKWKKEQEKVKKN
tara:strand:- start:3051 stop:3224 length:174 start_codon:yes stop_codon:yes gene_type:complete